MRTMKDSGIEWIGEIPENWEVLSLKRLISARRGGAWGDDAANNYGDRICLRVADFNYDGLCIKEGDKTIRNYNPQTIKNLRLGSNDLLIEKSGGGEKTPVGRCVLPTGYEGCLYANFIDKLVIKAKCHRKYVTYLMYVAYLNGVNIPHIKQTTGIQNLDVERYLSERVVSPSFDEQKKIADFLDGKCVEIDELVQTEEKMIEELKAYKQSVITEAVTKGLNPSAPMKDSGIEWIGKIPASWEVKKLKQFCDGALKYGANANGIAYRTDLARYVRITDILDNRLRDDILKQSLPNEIANDYILQDNDILFARSGGTVGKTFIFDASKYGKCAFAGYLIRARISAENIAKYVYYYTLSTCYNEWKNRIFIQSTIQNIGASKYSMLDITAPSLDEQKQIADYLDEECAKIDEIIALRNEQINQLKDYKKSLIYEYVTGKKEVV